MQPRDWIIISIIAFVVWWMPRRRNWQNDPATEKQKAYLHDLGYRGSTNLTKGQASELIDEYKMKR